MVFVTYVISVMNVFGGLLTRCHPDVGEEHGKGAGEGAQTWDVPHARGLPVSKNTRKTI